MNLGKIRAIIRIEVMLVRHQPDCARFVLNYAPNALAYLYFTTRNAGSPPLGDLVQTITSGYPEGAGWALGGIG